jgi:hypothetical protein
VAYVLRPVPIVRPPAPDIPVPALRVAGHAVPAEGDVIGESLNLVRRYALGEVTIRFPDGRHAQAPARRPRRRDRSRAPRRVRPRGAACKRAPSAASTRPLSRERRAARRAAADRHRRERRHAKLLEMKGELDAPRRTPTSTSRRARSSCPRRSATGSTSTGRIARLDAAFRRARTSGRRRRRGHPSAAPRELELGNVKFDHVLGYFETRYTAERQVRRTASTTCASRPPSSTARWSCPARSSTSTASWARATRRTATGSRP